MKNLVLSLFILIPLVACSQQASVKQATVNQLSELSAQESNNIVVLDVRTAQEVNEGHIAGSRHADVLRTDEFTMAVKGMDKDKTYYVICRSGGRSNKAANMMKDMGFKNIYNVAGGMNAWHAQQLPIE